METTASDSYDRYNKNVSRNALRSVPVTAAGRSNRYDRYNNMETQDT